MSEPADEAASANDVHRLEVGGRRFVVVGTAHISRDSVDLVRKVIEAERPDCVCLELDAQRYEALSQEQRWEDLDLRDVMRRQQLATLMANLILASYQHRLGLKLGVTPGSELLEAGRTAEELQIPVALCDRDIRVTLRRAWHSLALHRKAMLVSTFVASAFESPDLTEEELRRIRQKDVLSELMAELGEAMPALKRVLIDERDAYLAQKIRESEGECVVAVVGAGHVQGMLAALSVNKKVDLDEINEIPRVSPIWKWVGWAIPVLIVGSIAWIGLSQGREAAGDNAWFWFLANAIPSGIGGLAALAHPATIAAAFLSAPFTSLTPVIGAGYVAAFVQAWMRPPKVSEFKSVGTDMARPAAWWQNRLLKIFMVFLATTLGSVIGTWVGFIEIVGNLAVP
ncbi:MAG: TraB/GumN family protein [Myxococcota bacterium]|nr:TraB/GumN family protein [Myxococcota bacterium]